MIGRLKIGGLVIVLLGMSAVLLLQQKKINRLVAEGADLRSQLEERSILRENNEHLSELLKAAVETSHAEQTELMRLRGQSVRMRQLDQENAQLKAQSGQLARQIRPAQLPVVSSTTPALDANTTDLGVVELQDGIAASFDLGGGTNCVVTPTALSDGNTMTQITMVLANADGTLCYTNTFEFG